MLFLLYNLISAQSLQEWPTPDDYAIVFDCGSSGTRIHVYGLFNDPKTVPIELESLTHKSQSNYPISLIYINPDHIRHIFEDDLQPYAEELIPQEFRKHCIVYVMGTASMRALPELEQDTIYNKTREFLSTQSPFWNQFQYGNNSFLTLTGYQEGIYAWFAANYADLDFEHTFAISEIGSGSAQIAFKDDDSANSQYHRYVEFGNRNYTVFAHSWNELGIDSALRNLSFSLAGKAGKSEIDMPCHPKGLSLTVNDIELNGTGIYDECVKLFTENTLINGKCDTEKCMFDGVPFPHHVGSLFALSVFYYPAQFFRVNNPETLWPAKQEDETLENIIRFGQHFCSLDWSTIQDTYNPTKDPKTNQNLQNYCVQIAYGNTFLENGLHYPKTSKEVRRLSTYINTTVSWAYGVILAKASLDIAPKPQKASLVLPIVLGVVAGLAIIALIVFLIIKCRKSNEESDDFQIDESLPLGQHQFRESDHVGVDVKDANAI